MLPETISQVFRKQQFCITELVPNRTTTVCDMTTEATMQRYRHIYTNESFQGIALQ